MVPMRPPSLINASQTTFGEGGRVVVWRCEAGRGGEERDGNAGVSMYARAGRARWGGKGRGEVGMGAGERKRRATRVSMYACASIVGRTHILMCVPALV